MILVLALALPASAASPLPAAPLCPHPSGGTAYLLDGASLTYGATQLTCDGEFSCTYSLPAGMPARFRTEGSVTLDLACGGVAALSLGCSGGACVPERLTRADAEPDQRPFRRDGWPAYGVSSSAAEFLGVMHADPAALMARPGPVVAEVQQLALGLADTLLGCQDLGCTLGNAEVDWRGAGDAAAVLALNPVEVVSIDRARWHAHGWTAHFVSRPAAGVGRLTGELDCYDFSSGDDLPAAACALTLRDASGQRTIAAYSEQTTEAWDDGDPTFVQEARVGGLVIGLGGGPGVRTWARRPDTAVAAAK